MALALLRLGGGADLALIRLPINSSSYASDTKATSKIGVTYAVLKNANLGLNYTSTTMICMITKMAFTGFEADYTFDGALKGLTTSLVYEDGAKDANVKMSFWFKAGYKF